MAVKRSPFRRIAVKAVHAADEKHGERIVMLDIRKLTVIADYMILITANSSPHTRALIEEIKTVFTCAHIEVLHREGRRDSEWHVLDYGGVVIHVMNEEVRRFYALDKLWGEARKIQWSKNSSGKK